MNVADVIGYAYEADVHCVDCARMRARSARGFGRAVSCSRRESDENGIRGDALDSEWNPVLPIFAGDEGAESEHCGDCNVALID